ncbi:MAG: homoserine kinase, partial [Rhodothermia bacterium]|nr:homoserine kinase [Rhodothermia bacterium]
RGDTAIPVDPKENTASVSAIEVFRHAGYEGGAEIRIDKGIPFGSGLGGSAASAAAGAAAANELLGSPLNESQLVACALRGEAIASKSLHGDNVIPALLGGGILVDSDDPALYRRIVLDLEIFFAIVVPDIKITTADARDDLPAHVGLRDAVTNASALALLIDGLRAGDVDLIRRMILRDRVVEPVRRKRIPCFDAAYEAAAYAGAAGCAISGSGPTLFTVAASAEEAGLLANRMSAACRESGVECRALVSRVHELGAHVRVSEG